MKEGREGVDRRRMLQTALAAAGALLLPPRTSTAEAAPKNPRPADFDKLDRLKKPSAQIQWFADKLGPQGSLWPMLRDGDFTNEELRRLLRALGSVSRALNNPSPEDMKDGALAEIRKTIPSISDTPHLYTVACRVPDTTGATKWHDFGNAQVYSYEGRPYIQSSAHVISGIAKYYPAITRYFRAPTEINNRPVDVTFASLESEPVVSSSSVLRMAEMPADLDPTNCHGQINVVMGYKDDGGALSIAGIVLPTPEKMHNRLEDFWNSGRQDRDIKSILVKDQQKDGGLFLMPSFLGELGPDGENFRSAGRSGSFRLVFSPKHRRFVPASNFASGKFHVDRTTGLFRGWVDSMTHVTRGLKEMSKRMRGKSPFPSISPRHVPNLEQDTFEIIPGVYLRSVHRRVASSFPESWVTGVRAENKKP